MRGSSMKVFVTRLLPDTVMGRLELSKEISELRVNREDRPLSRKELEDGIGWCDIILSQLVDNIDSSLITINPNLKLIANYAVGFNNIDVPSATEKKIPVTNTPGVLTETTADLTWALLMAISRRIVEADKFMRDGNYEAWSPTLLMGSDVHNKTLGIIGFGRIGFALAKRAQGFGMNILYSDVEEKSFDSEVGAKYTDMYSLLKQSDFVSLHPFYDEKSHHLISERELKVMMPTSYLINVSRGPVIDEKALVKALSNDEIAGAALDVFENEPDMATGLADLDNVIIVPHIGSATLDTRTAMGNIAVENILARINNSDLLSCVNPEVL